MFTGKKIAVIGTGIMPEAIIQGLLAGGLVNPQQLMGSNILAERNRYLAEQYQIITTTDNLAAIDSADLILLAIKPQLTQTILPTLQGHISAETLVVSIMAGVSLTTLQNTLKHDRIVRSMPNTPAQIGAGMTVWCATTSVTPVQKEQANAIFGAMGETLYVADEKQIDMATALNGSGPAYIFLLLESMIDAGVQLGFTRDTAQKLVYQTVLGSVQYAQKSGQHPAVLRNGVTSPAGTTAAALYELEKGGIRTIMADAILAAHQRAVELGKVNF